MLDIFHNHRPERAKELPESSAFVLSGCLFCNLRDPRCCPGLLCQCPIRGGNLSFAELLQGNECKIKLPENEAPETVVSGLKRPLCRSGKALFCHLYSQILDKRVAQHGSFSTFCTLFPIFHASRKPARAILFTGNPPFSQPFPSGCCGPWQMGAISLLPSRSPLESLCTQANLKLQPPP